MGQVAATICRHKILIGCITIASALVSGLYAYTRKPVWEGSFQIVLENQSSISSGILGQLTTANPMLSSLTGLSGGNLTSSLATEVKILQSPSVLKPVYDFVKSKKAAAGDDVYRWKYKDWVNNNLSIELAQGTTILNLTYQDTNEDLILPVLRQISDTYQEYSKRDSAN